MILEFNYFNLLEHTVSQIHGNMTEEEALERALKASMSENATKTAKPEKKVEEPKVKEGLLPGVRVKVENQQNGNSRKSVGKENKPQPETPKPGIKNETPKSGIQAAGIKTENPKPGKNKTQMSVPPHMVHNQGARGPRTAPVVPAFQVRLLKVNFLMF